MADNRLPFLGNGWSFPPIFSNQGGKVDMVSGQSNVHKSIQIILSTNLGERVYHEDFGAGLETRSFRTCHFSADQYHRTNNSSSHPES